MWNIFVQLLCFHVLVYAVYETGGVLLLQVYCLLFSCLLQIKSKQRNRLAVESDIRCALSSTIPNIEKLVGEKRIQKSGCKEKWINHILKKNISCIQVGYSIISKLCSLERHFRAKCYIQVLFISWEFCLYEIYFRLLC